MTLNPQLLAECELDNQVAQMQVYDLLFPSLFNSAMGILKNKAQAEDVAQESILVVFSKLGDLEDKSRIHAWAKRITINKAINQLKKKNSIIPLTHEDEKWNNIEDLEQEKFLWQEVHLKYLKKAIEELPDGYRSILHLYIMEDLDHKTIGELLGIDASTSRSQYTRAKRKLKHLIETKYARFIEREI